MLHRTAIDGFAALSLGVALAAAPADAKTWSRDFAVAARPLVKIKCQDAKLRIHSHDERTVLVRAESFGTVKGIFGGRVDPRVEMHQDGNTVEIEAEVHERVAGFVVSTVRLEVDVYLPRETDLSVRSVDGDVTMEPVSGRLEIRTVDGSLRARGLKGDVVLESVDGSIDAQDLDGRLRLRTSDGDAIIRGRFDRVTATSVDGDLRVTAERGSRMGDEWGFESSDGNLDLRIPGDLKASFEAHTSDGSLDLNLPLRLQGRISRNAVRGDLNGGGPIMRLRSVDGEIRVAALN